MPWYFCRCLCSINIFFKRKETTRILGDDKDLHIVSILEKEVFPLYLGLIRNCYERNPKRNVCTFFTKLQKMSYNNSANIFRTLVFRIKKNRWMKWPPRYNKTFLCTINMSHQHGCFQCKAWTPQNEYGLHFNEKDWWMWNCASTFTV